MLHNVSKTMVSLPEVRCNYDSKVCWTCNKIRELTSQVLLTTSPQQPTHNQFSFQRDHLSTSIIGTHDNLKREDFCCRDCFFSIINQNMPVCSRWLTDGQLPLLYSQLTQGLNNPTNCSSGFYVLSCCSVISANSRLSCCVDICRYLYLFCCHMYIVHPV